MQRSPRAVVAVFLLGALLPRTPALGQEAGTAPLPEPEAPVVTPAPPPFVAQPPAPPTKRERSTDPDHIEPGFAQEPDEELRNPRVRLELNALAAFQDATFRWGPRSTSDTIRTHHTLGMERWSAGIRGALTLKLHRWFALGAEYLSVAGGTRGAKTLHRDVRLGGVPAEIPAGFRASSAFELQQVDLTARFVAADDAEFRAEFALGVTWVGYRLAVHPKLPGPLVDVGGLPGGGRYEGDSRRVQAVLAPSLGTFFAWNFHPRIAIFVDSCSAYFSIHRAFGSIATINRGGFRFRIFEGIEVVVGGFFASGQVYDFRERLPFIEKPANVRKATWNIGGPEIGLSWTY